MPWYPSAKACPAAIKPTVQCFFPTLYQVLLFDFSSFGEKLFFCLRGYRRAIAQSAMQKTAGALSEAVPLPSRRRTGGEWLEPATLPHHEQAMPRNRAAMHKQLSSPKRSPPPHTPLKHPAMSLLCIHIPQNSCTIFVILLCRG